MTRAQLEHVIRAAGAISGSDELIVIGSQALLASHPEATGVLAQSMDVDLYPADAPGKADLIDGSIGEMSLFHDTFGYYAHGVGPETAILPKNWRARACVVQSSDTNNVRAVCLHPVDLAVSKLVAGRERDMAFVAAMLEDGFITRSRLADVICELTDDQAERARHLLQGM
jgi:hypothetical protein